MSADGLQTKILPHLCDFIRTHQADIIADWSKRVRALSPAHQLSERALIDHLPSILARIADIVETVHTGGEISLQGTPETHAVERLQSGFDLDQIVVEYGLLRMSILDLWQDASAASSRLPSCGISMLRSTKQSSSQQSAILTDARAFRINLSRKVNVVPSPLLAIKRTAPHILERRILSVKPTGAHFAVRRD